MNNHLRTPRQERDRSQGVLADRLEVSRQTVNALETGRYDPGPPRAFTTARLFSRRIEGAFVPDAAADADDADSAAHSPSARTPA